MAGYLRYGTAAIVTLGPFLDKTDGVTFETALTITNEKISMVVDKDEGSAPTLVLDNVTGATSGTDNDLNYITNCDAALMQLELTAANTSYLGRCVITVSDAANHCPVWKELTILPQQVFDSLILGTDLLDANVAQWLGTAAHAATENGTPCVEVVRWAGNDVPATGINGTPKVDLAGILGTAISGTAADIAASFSTFFNVNGLTATAANITTLLGKFTGITLLAQWLGAAFGKQTPNSTALTEIRATGAGSGTFDPATDSIEGIRDTEPLGTAMRGTDGANTTTPPTANENADALLGRNVSGGSSTGRLVKQALHFLRNKWSVSGTTLTVYDTDDVSSSWTAEVTSNSSADPITGNDPT